MPAHKRSLSENRDDEDPVHHAKLSRLQLEFDDDEPDQEDLHRSNREDDQLDEDAEEDSEDSSSSGPDEKPEFVTVELPEIRKDVQCPICLGIIKKTRTVMECLHRFCRECIDKSMRLGNNECPACRTHCASRRSLRDDPNYDALIAALYPDIDEYDEEELAFHEEERNRNKQIQAAIAQISQRQTEALVRRRALGKDTTGAFTTRSQRRNAHSRRRNYRGIEQGSEDNEDENDNNEGKYSSSTDERCTEVRQRRFRRHPGARPPQPSTSAANSDGGCLENDLETSREGRGISPGLVWNPDLLNWGRGGARSNTRHSGSNNKSSRTSRISKITDHIRSVEENTNELLVPIMLISSDTKKTPSLQQPHHHCLPCLSVRHLCEYIACQTPLRAEDIEMLAVKGNDNIFHDKPILNPSALMNDPDLLSLLVNDCKDKLQILEEQETLAGLEANFSYVNHYLFLAYRQKESVEQVKVEVAV